MPKVTTLTFDRVEVEELALQARGKQVDWNVTGVSTVKSEGVVLRKVGVVTRQALATIVEATPDARGQRAEVVMLNGNEMKVELTRKDDGDGEKATAEETEAQVEMPEPQ